MQNKKFWMGVVAVFITLMFKDFISYMLFITPRFESIFHLTRPEAEVKMGIVVVMVGFFAYFFTWIFSKGYEGKGVMEGIRYGLAVALMMMLPLTYVVYASMPIQFSLTEQLGAFLHTTIDCVLAGITLTWIVSMKPKQTG